MQWNSIGMQDSRNLFLKRTNVVQFDWYETVWGENPTFYLFGGEGGIRTHVCLRTNGFQDRPVMTASVPLQKWLG